MIKRVFLLFIYALLIFSPGFSSIVEMYRESLKIDPYYQQQLINLKSSSIGVSQIDGFYIPYLTLDSGLEKGIVFGEEGLEYFGLSLSMEFKKVFGADISLSIPYTFIPDSSGGNTNEFGDLSLSVRRQLFTEDDALLYRKKASFFSDLFSISQREWTVLSQIIDEIFNKFYYSSLMQQYKKREFVLQRLYENSVNIDEQEDYKKQLLNIEKLTLDIQKNLIDLDEYYSGSSEKTLALKDEAMVLLQDTDIFGYEKDVLSREDILAMKLELEALNIEERFWFLPYVPNPTFIFNASYDFKEIQDSSISFDERFSWSVSVQVQVPITDRGERELESLRRKNGSYIQSLEIEDIVDTARKNLQKIDISRRLSEIDISLKKFDVEDYKDQLEKMRKKFELKIVSLEDLQLSEIDEQIKELELMKLLQQSLLLKISYMMEKNIPVEYVLGGKL